VEAITNTFSDTFDDVATASLTEGDLLYYRSGTWENEPLNIDEDSTHVNVTYTNTHKLKVAAGKITNVDDVIDEINDVNITTPL